MAWAIWRNSLQIAENEPVDDEVQRTAASDRGLTIWVRPWSAIVLPSVPSNINKEEVFLLHTLLLHAGLPLNLIHRLMPFSVTMVLRMLMNIHGHGLIKEENGLWRVALLGYPAVRQYLESEGYLTDVF